MARYCFCTFIFPYFLHIVIIQNVRKGRNPAFRPRVDSSDCAAQLYRVMEDCWAEYPLERPSFDLVKRGLKPLIKATSGSLLDNLILKMEKYANDLEAIVEERTEAFMEEKRKSEELLNQMLPKYLTHWTLLSTIMHFLLISECTFNTLFLFKFIFSFFHYTRATLE